MLRRTRPAAKPAVVLGSSLGALCQATTPLFLERLGLENLAELPDLAPLLPETSALLDEHPDV